MVTYEISKFGGVPKNCIGEYLCRWENGTEAKYFGNKYHCIDGPAVKFADGEYWWYVHGKQCHDNESFMRMANINRDDMLAIILQYGNVRLYLC